MNKADELFHTTQLYTLSDTYELKLVAELSARTVFASAILSNTHILRVTSNDLQVINVEGQILCTAETLPAAPAEEDGNTTESPEVVNATVSDPYIVLELSHGAARQVYQAVEETGNVRLIRIGEQRGTELVSLASQDAMRPTFKVEDDNHMLIWSLSLSPRTLPPWCTTMSRVFSVRSRRAPRIPGTLVNSPRNWPKTLRIG